MSTSGINGAHSHHHAEQAAQETHAETGHASMTHEQRVVMQRTIFGRKMRAKKMAAQKMAAFFHDPVGLYRIFIRHNPHRCASGTGYY